MRPPQADASAYWVLWVSNHEPGQLNMIDFIAWALTVEALGLIALPVTLPPFLPPALRWICLFEALGHSTVQLPGLDYRTDRNRPIGPRLDFWDGGCPVGGVFAGGQKQGPRVPGIPQAPKMDDCHSRRHIPGDSGRLGSGPGPQPFHHPHRTADGLRPSQLRGKGRVDAPPGPVAQRALGELLLLRPT